MGMGNSGGELEWPKGQNNGGELEWPEGQNNEKELGWHSYTSGVRDNWFWGGRV
jgi:hypothetical protein